MTTIEHCELVRANGEKVPAEIKHGWDLKTSIQCDTLWQQSLLDLLTEIVMQKHDDEKLTEIVASISMEDSHWKWFDKAMQLNSSEYIWLHLYAESKPQGACVIYHPKQSAIDAGNIFYIKFVAVAPWNRSCLVRQREFKHVGSTLIRAALKFAVQKLKLQPGFCLHSLPGAKGFYESFNMVNIPEKDEDKLLYFELPQAKANDFMNAA